MANKHILTFKKHIRLLCIITTVVIPIINNFVLSLVLSNIRGDIMLSGVSEALSIFTNALDTLNLFLLFGLLVNSLVRFGINNSRDLIMFCILRIFIIYTAYLAIGAIITYNFADTIESNLLYCITNGFIDILLLGGTVILCGFLSSKFLDEKNTDITIRNMFDKNNPLINIILWVTVLISTFLLSGCIINTVTNISNYGAGGLNRVELVYLATPYLRLIFKAVFGYFVMIFVAKWLDLQWKNLYSTDGQKKSK